MESIEYDEGHVTAEVSGSEDEPYLVEIGFNEDGEVETWDCDCPYSWGPVCKHTVAVLLAVREKGVEQFLPKPAEEAVPLEELVRWAEREQLAALILEHCREDRRFRSQVLSELEESEVIRMGWMLRLLRTMRRPTFNSWKRFQDMRRHEDQGKTDRQDIPRAAHSAEAANEKGLKS